MEKNDYRNVSGIYKRAGEKDGQKVYYFIASTPDVDRHRTVINQEGWQLENFKKNPVIGYQHNLYGDMCNAPNPDDVIGKAVDIFTEDGNLMIGIVFDNESETGRKVESKVDRGFLNTVSVGFAELEGHSGDKERGEDPKLYYFDKQELYEVSVVNIPSNPNAKKKTFRSQAFDALKFIYRELGGKYRMSEIETLTVREILDLLDGKEEKKYPIELFKYRKSALTRGNK